MRKHPQEAHREFGDPVQLVRRPFPGIDAWTIKGVHGTNAGPPGAAHGDMHYNVELGVVMAGVMEMKAATP